MADERFGRRDPDSRGYYGAYGGRFVPETLVAPVEELEREYLAARRDPEFLAELDRLLKHYVGRPTPVYEAERLASWAGGRARILLKREDLAHTGAPLWVIKKIDFGDPSWRKNNLVLNIAIGYPY